uniref:Uncharacterized protein n=1 Tax=Cucumis melo TaxID=3656 RepID=A0A9I9ELL9_CUCME
MTHDENPTLTPFFSSPPPFFSVRRSTARRPISSPMSSIRKSRPRKISWLWEEALRKIE